MHRKNLLLKRGLVMLCLAAPAPILSLGQTAPVQQTAEKVSLKSALLDLQTRYNVSILFEDKVVNELQVDRALLNQQTTNLDQLLTQILQQFNLQFRKTNSSSYVIITPEATPQAAPAEGNTEKKKVSGIITDEKNEPLIGAAVSEKGTTNGTVTDADGRFTLNVAGNAQLHIAQLGYQEQDVTVGSQNEVAVTMFTGTKGLDEVVVIGYGTTTRKDLTGSVYSVKSEDITRIPTYNAIEAIQGRVPGVDITRSSGAAGGGTNVSVRGNRSIRQPLTNNQLGVPNPNAPLYVIDGYQGGNISDLNPGDIESIEVLKDASATAVYGALGANGVIIVTTKKGSSGKPKVSYSGYYGVNGYTAYPKPRIGDDYVRLRREAWKNDTSGIWQSPADDSRIFNAFTGEYDLVQAGKWVDWVDLVTENGTQQSHNVSVQAGNERTKVFLSGGYFKENSMLRNDNLSRYNVRLNIDQQLAKWAKVGALAQVTYYNQNRRRDPLSAATSLSPLGTPYDSLGRINLLPVPNNTSGISPLADERTDNITRDNTNTSAIMANAFLELTPIKGLSFRSNLGTNFNFSRQGLYNDATSLQQATGARINTSTVYNTYSKYYNWDNILTYTKSFSGHTITATAVSSYIQNDIEQLYGTANNQVLPSQLYYSLGNVDQSNRAALGFPYFSFNNYAYVGRINYNYKSRYLITLSQRYDGASRLVNKWDDFPAAAIGWNISEENFMKNVTVINNLKLRASYGASGNYNIPIYATQSVLLPYQTTLGGNVSIPSYIFNTRIGTTDLGWERSVTANLGLDFTLLKSRITGVVDVYRTYTTGILLDRTLPQSTGVNTVFQNIGETENKGIEIGLTTQNIVSKSFNWNSTLTFTSNSEKITKLTGGKDIIATSSPETNSFLIGHPVNSFYTFIKDGIWQLDEAERAGTFRYGNVPFKPGDIKLRDLNGDSVISESGDRTYIGSTVPKWSAGFQNNFSYKGIDLGIYLYMRWGQMVNAEFLGRYNPSGEGNGPSGLDYWTPENPTNDFPRPRARANINTYAGYQSLRFVDGSFFKIKTLTLGYSLPSSLTGKIFASKIRLYATGSNLFTKAKSHYLNNYDPERGGAESYPLTRQFVFGVNVDY